MTSSTPAADVTRDGDFLRLPGLATAHSHAFQRALRGRTHRRSGDLESFWSWRGLMYHLVERLDPETIYGLSRFAYTELAMSGVTAVGEFHYVHHTPDGTAYIDRLELADAVIRAARDCGVRITLIRTAYLRGGYRQELAPAQRRFFDPCVETVLEDVEALSERYSDDPGVEVALAAHSIRAVPIEGVLELASFAREREMPFHMHVAEQRRELEECRAEYQLSPMELLAEKGVLGERFVAVHATHLSAGEIAAVGNTRTTVCLCRTTERDLGDGLPAVEELALAGARFCVGVDSHCGPDAFEELRAVELDERSRTERRVVAMSGAELLEIGTREGYRAIGMSAEWQHDEVRLDATQACLAGTRSVVETELADHVVFAATSRAVDRVTVAGESLVESGRHRSYEAALEGYEKALERLDL